MNILIAEDDELHARLLMHLLSVRFPGAEIRHVEDARSALAALIDPGPHARTVLLLDQNLPGGPGMAVAATIRKSATLKRIPIIMISNDGSDQNRGEALARDIDGFLVKPVDIRRLVGMLDGTSLYWRIEELPRDLGHYRNCRKSPAAA